MAVLLFLENVDLEQHPLISLRNISEKMHLALWK